MDDQPAQFSRTDGEMDLIVWRACRLIGIHIPCPDPELARKLGISDAEMGEPLQNQAEQVRVSEESVDMDVASPAVSGEPSARPSEACGGTLVQSARGGRGRGRGRGTSGDSTPRGRGRGGRGRKKEVAAVDVDSR